MSTAPRTSNWSAATSTAGLPSAPTPGPAWIAPPSSARPSSGQRRSSAATFRTRTYSSLATRRSTSTLLTPSAAPQSRSRPATTTAPRCATQVPSTSWTHSRKSCRWDECRIGACSPGPTPSRRNFHIGPKPRNEGQLVSTTESAAPTFTGRTAWARNLASPVRDFLSTETGSALVLLGAAVAALLWANSPWSGSYESVWTTKLSIQVGSSGVEQDLRHWVNNGLMTFFFLVIGLEAKRELDTGELRERRRIAVPVVAAVGGIAVPIAIYLAFNAGGSGAHGFGAAMSTDTAFALCVLALVAPQGTRLRVFLLTLAVVDDLVALAIIATVYTEQVSFVPLVIAVSLFGALLPLRYAPIAWRRQAVLLLGVAFWV